MCVVHRACFVWCLGVVLGAEIGGGGGVLILFVVNEHEAYRSTSLTEVVYQEEGHRACETVECVKSSEAA